MRRFALLLLIAAAPLPRHAPPRVNPDSVNGRSGLAVPRFVSLSAGEANMRTGPGRQYPVSWTYRRKHLPLEIVREWGIWRQVRDPAGTTGWFDGKLLSGTRTLVVTRDVRDVHARADVAAPVVWRAEPGVVLTVKTCAAAWCRVETDGHTGWLLRAEAWGSYAGEGVG